MQRSSIYKGVRGDRCRVTVDGRLLQPRLDLFRHSPTGYEWGYRGSGPAQLALAILAHHLGDDERAVKLHQEFKRTVIAGLSQDSWQMTTAEVAAVVLAIDTKGV